MTLSFDAAQEAVGFRQIEATNFLDVIPVGFDHFVKRSISRL
jgi:hypothetical protein